MRPTILAHIRNRLTHATAVVSVTLLTAVPAGAAGSSMPWEEPLQQILHAVGRAAGTSGRRVF